MRMPAGIAVAFLLLPLGLAQAQKKAEARPDLARDAGQLLGCDAKKVTLKELAGKNPFGPDVEASGCKREAVYTHNGAGQLTVSHVGREVDPAWIDRAAADLTCPKAGTTAELLSKRDSGITPQLKARGCGREATYGFTTSAPKLENVVSTAAPEVTAQVAADIGCKPEEITVKSTAQPVKGAPVAMVTTKGCRKDEFWSFHLGPLRRSVIRTQRPGIPSLETQAVAGLSCQDKVTFYVRYRQGKTPGSNVAYSADVTGCGKSACFASSDGSSWSTRACPVMKAAAPAPAGAKP